MRNSAAMRIAPLPSLIAFMAILMFIASQRRTVAEPATSRPTSRAGDSPTSRSSGAASPQALMKRMSTAWRTGNRDELALCYDQSDADSKLLAEDELAVFDRTVAADKFGQAVRKKFGDPIRFALSREFDGTRCVEVAEMINKAAVEVHGDTATAPLSSGATGTFAMRRRNNVWLVNNTAAFKHGLTTPERVRQRLQSLKEASRTLGELVPLVDAAHDWAEFEKLAEQKTSSRPAETEPSSPAR